MNKQFGNERCSVCGKRPDEVDQVILKEDQRKPRGSHLRPMHQRVLQRIAQVMSAGRPMQRE